MSQSAAWLFPGQGSQFVGMGKSLFDAHGVARERFEQADALLGRSLSDLCFQGPDEELKKTENTQPALYVCAVAARDVLRERGLEPSWVAGHSLGEYPALYTAGVLDFETGLRLVQARGNAMAEAGRQSAGTMAAVIGLDIERIDEVCGKASSGDSVVVVANENSPVQTVISGSVDAVDRACALAREAGAKRALPLPVSGAFHSPLVEAARRGMAGKLKEAEFKAPRCGFIPNVTGEPRDDPEAIRQGLVEQIASRVRWVRTVRSLAERGVQAGLEAGPGNVLAGLVKRIDRSVAVRPAGTAEDIGKLAE